ncbi:hypothetical protein K438DRAFT_2016218 [Mycena galopus ATCC 62051]|nr:hypothetical protein K438DRAFT_2016218 [Mycena galopus ATCC 62051]
MSPKLPVSVDRIIDYTEVAANALQDIATEAQIPFLGGVCTLILTIIPVVHGFVCTRVPHIIS